MSKLLKEIGLICLIMIFSCLTAMAGKPGNVLPDIPITNYLADYDANGAPYLVQSDGHGAYQTGGGVVSVLVANGYNWLVNGDWRLDLEASIGITSQRAVAITFDGADTVKPGDPGYTYPANPPWWGTQNNSVRTENKCTLENKDMLTMRAGDKFTCPGLIRMAPLSSAGDYYRLHMGFNAPGSEEMQVSCNSADSGGCKDWFIDPIPVVHSDGSTSPGRTRARLIHNGGTKRAPDTDNGEFYLTYHIHATRP